MVMLWLAALALAQDEPSVEQVPEDSAEQAPAASEPPGDAELGTIGPEAATEPDPPRGDEVPSSEELGEELTPEELERLEVLLEEMIGEVLEGALLDSVDEAMHADASAEFERPPEPDDGFDEPLVVEDEWLLQRLPEDWHEPAIDDPLARRVPLWFGLEVGTMIGARVELSREQWPVEGAVRVGAYTRVEDGAALQPTAIGALEVGGGFQFVVGGGVTLRDGEVVPVGNLAIQRDRRETPAHIQSGVLFDREGWRGLDVTLCWLW